MNLRKVDPHKIRIPETRVTAQMDEETARQFEESVKEVGIDEPIKVYDVDGEIWLADGLHRLQQALKMGLSVVEAYVREGTRVDVLCNNLMSGHLRGKHPLSGMVKVIEELWKVHNLDPEEVAKKTGLTRDHVEDIMLITQLTPMVRAAVDDGSINFSQAKALTRIKDPVGQETVYGQWQLARWPAKELNEFITEVIRIKETPPSDQPPAPPAPPPQIRCFYCQRVKDVSQLRNPNTCDECVGVLLGIIAQAKAEMAKEIPPETK
jgi:ParB family transcriptional regulator, chromosome partitioning protein